MISWRFLAMLAVVLTIWAVLAFAGLGVWDLVS